MRHFEHAWLKESWATYISTCWLEDHASHEQFRYDVIMNIKSYIAETASYMRPIVTRTYDSSWEMFDAHLYPGGAVRIHMLRHLLGDDVFWSAVKNYVNTFATKVVETEDFKRCLEQESGLNLTRFFDQWLYGIGYPKIKATYEYLANSKQVQIVLEQTQVSKKDNIPVFDVTIEVDVIDADGKAFTAHVEFEENNPRAVAVLTIGEAKPTIIEVDPRGKVLHALEFNPGEAILEATIKGGRDMGSRIHAYKELIKIGSVSALKKVRDCLPLEQFFGVRAQVYAALSASKTQTAIDILASSLPTETHPRALTALLAACTVRDEGIRAGILSLLKNVSSLTYNARAQAYANLGRQRNLEDLPLLIAAASDPVIGTAGIVRANVMMGIAYLRSEEGHRFLLSRLPRGSEPERAQIAVITALGVSGQWLDKLEKRKTAEAISEFLRDPFHRLRRAVLPALRDLEAKEHAAAAAGTLAGFPEQDQNAISKIIKGIREADPSGDKVKEMSSTIEDLESRLKKMEQQFQVLEARQKEAEKAKEAADKEAAEPKA
ncbi:hypothetical protein HDU67_000827 [Dinochytrium kinnereticum]|nr:hypothetical protein HDU67_000827 [Dinochytrium kinnereticum]